MYKLCLFRQELLAQLNDNARSERNLTDEQMLRIVIDEYLSQQVFEPSLIAKFSANSLCVGKILPSVTATCQSACRMSILNSVTGLIFNSRRMRRSSICPSKLNKISFLHYNLHYIAYCLFATGLVKPKVF